MMELMDSFVARGGSVRASKSGNLILVRGSAAERRTMVDIILSFDVDWMENQSAGVATLSYATPEEMVSKLEAVFAEDTESAGRNALKVIPLERLNGVVVIANSQDKVKRAMTWIRRLDKASVTETNYFVYAVQNGSAVALAEILKVHVPRSAIHGWNQCAGRPRSADRPGWDHHRDNDRNATAPIAGSTVSGRQDRPPGRHSANFARRDSFDHLAARRLRRQHPHHRQCRQQHHRHPRQPTRLSQDPCNAAQARRAIRFRS